MKFLGKYKNGNYWCVLFSDGTKVRYNDKASFDPIRPESIDLKITNRCFMGCPMCHENSTPDGVHGDILNLPFIDTMFPYSEVAIGGGNPLLHPDLVPFLEKLKERKLIANMTVNQFDFMENVDFLKNLVDNRLIYGLGVSLVCPGSAFIKALKQFPNAVVHVINGIVTVGQLKELSNNDFKILILGYKEFRRGKDLYGKDGNHIENLKSQLYDKLPEIVNDGWFNCVSFDNLAIKQLEPKRFMSDDEWSSFYLGDDGFASMYIDAVNMEYARSSTSTDRYPLMEDIKDMFNVVRCKKME